jgi:hypothetical protein
MQTRMPDPSRDATESLARPWEPPGFEVIPLACEISGYAPDDRPLF